MGALTSNRKRGEDFYKSLVSTSQPYDQSCTHIAKKPKFSVSINQNIREVDRPINSNSVSSRISLYPRSNPGFSREVHAPVKRSRFGPFSATKKIENSASSEESPAGRMGNFFGIQLMKAKASGVKRLKFFRKQNDAFLEKEKEKEVIEIDDDNENQDMSVDSSIEERETADVLKNEWKEGHRAVMKLPECEVKMGPREPGSLDSSVVTDVSNMNVKFDCAEKMDFMLLDQKPDASGVPVHEKLYDSAKKRDGKLHFLNCLIGYYEQWAQRFLLFRPQKKEEQVKKDVADECFVPLTEEEESEVTSALSNFNRRKVLVNHVNSNIDITGEKLQCLSPSAWLNDEAINVYLELLKEREKREPEKFLKCHFFNTFFYKKLISGRGGYNFQSVRRWTTQKKLGYSLLECDKIFVPIHQEIHWCLAIINKKDEKFQYLDSLRGVDSQVLNVLARYYVDEVKDKCGKDLNVSLWEQEFVKELPEQENGFDCGVFMIKYADFLSRDIGLCFSQEHMPYFRRRTAKEILKLRAE